MPLPLQRNGDVILDYAASCDGITTLHGRKREPCALRGLDTHVDASHLAWSWKLSLEGLSLRTNATHRGRIIKTVTGMAFSCRTFTYLPHAAKAFLRCQQIHSLSGNSPHFMETKRSQPHSQQPSTCPYPEPDLSSPCPLPIPVLEDPF